jgi:membrane-bound serine protease (ClpP class)
MQRRSARDPRTTFLARAAPATPAPSRPSARLPRALIAIALLGAVAAFGAAPSAAAPVEARPAKAGDGPGYVSVIEVSGLLDRVLVDFVETQITTAEDQGALALVLQLNSTDSVVAAGRLDQLVERIRGSSVPVDVWVGPSGSRAMGDTTHVLAAARTVGVAPKSRVEVTRTLLGDRSLGGDAAVGDKVGADTAVELGLADNAAPTIGEFVLGLDGVESRVVGQGEDRQREPVSQARFAQLTLAGQLMHTVASPPVAYLLFVIGLALILFELFTAGVGVAGMVGAGALVLGSYGLAALPTNPSGIALLLLAVLAFGVDVQTGVPRLWSGIGAVAFIVGSLVLFDGLSLSWITLLVAIVGMVLAMVAGMPSMVRTRFSTPVIDRGWLVGERGVAATGADPDGVVTIRGAPWRARASTGHPVPPGAEIEVVSVDGLVLDVEPVPAASARQVP